MEALRSRGLATLEEETRVIVGEGEESWAGMRFTDTTWRCVIIVKLFERSLHTCCVH